VTTDILIIGAGIAGASAAFFLAPKHRVVIVERESQPGYHTSGRSAAQFAEAYGAPIVRALARASRGFFEQPPAGFADHPLLTPRASLVVARSGQEPELLAEQAASAAVGIATELVDEAGARRLFPPLLRGLFTAGLNEPGAADLDVDALLQGYLRGARAAGARLLTDAEVTALERRDGLWHARTSAGDVAAPIVVDAAGAWADAIARLAGVRPLGLVPKRRTALVFAAPPDAGDTSGWAHTGDADETWYVKPQRGAFMGSLSDATPDEPRDAWPDDLDVAQAVANIEAATSLRVGRPIRSWAGLRSFVPDGTPVAGFALGADGFFWLTGQGGVGMLTSPAMGRAVAGLIAEGEVPATLRTFGITAAALAPDRPGL
jgi:D-arginine dehydrogenase